jgi:hypothetical protein
MLRLFKTPWSRYSKQTKHAEGYLVNPLKAERQLFLTFTRHTDQLILWKLHWWHAAAGTPARMQTPGKERGCQGWQISPYLQQVRP